MIGMEMRNRRIQVFEDTLQFCERNQEVIDRITASRKSFLVWSNKTELIKEKECTVVEMLGLKRYHVPCRIFCWNQSALDLISVLKKNRSQCVGTLLLSDSLYFGGNVLRGGEGEKEQFCRCTTLYPCLTTMTTQGMFSNPYLEFVGETCAYTRDVVCLRRGADYEWINHEDWCTSDVIIYTSMDVRHHMCMNVKECSTDVLERQQQECEQGQYRSLEVMLQMAVQQNLEELVIPVSQYVRNGCLLESMVEGMKTALEKYKYFFRAVHLVFA